MIQTSTQSEHKMNPQAYIFSVEVYIGLHVRLWVYSMRKDIGKCMHVCMYVCVCVCVNAILWGTACNCNILCGVLYLCGVKKHVPHTIFCQIVPEVSPTTNN